MQEIIVYRNPAEAAMWNLLGSANAFPIMVGVVAFFVVFLAVNRLLTQGKTFRQPIWKTNVALVFGALAAIGVIWKMV